MNSRFSVEHQLRAKEYNPWPGWVFLGLLAIAGIWALGIASRQPEWAEFFRYIGG